MKNKSIIAMAFGLVVGILPMAAQNASDKTLFFISNSHLDTQWNWDVKTSINEYVKNTLYDNMSLMDKYPSFNLNCEGAIKYMWMKEYYPDQYAKLQDYIDRGQWHVSGMSIDASDVMISSAESILHSMLYANKFYEKEFGVRGGYDIMLPDCFGFSYALPSLAHFAGVRGFHTAKLRWGASSYDKVGTFGIWQGVDGSQIYAIYKPMPYDNHSCYNKDMTADSEILSTINTNYKNYGLAVDIRYIGTSGDRGGALHDDANTEGENTPYWLDYNTRKTDGTIKVKLSSPDEIFDYLDKFKNDKYQVWDGELAMRSHGVGAYTSHGELKRFNRKNELLADAAEKASSLAYWLGARRYPTDELRDAWVRTLWQQHHDGITGTSIPKANEYSVNEYFIANRQFGQQFADAAASTIQYLDTRAEGTPVVVYNPLSHNRTDVVECTIACGAEPEGVRVFDKDGNEVLSQITGYADGQLSLIFAATVPSLGYAVYDIRTGEASTLTSSLTVDTDKRQVSNGHYRFSISANGDLRQLYDLQNSRSLTGTVQQQMMYDHEDTWPAWEISYTDDCRTAKGTVNENVQIELVEDGALRKSYRVQRTKEGSTFVQYIRMNALSDRVDFVNEVDWQSHERMLKVLFPFQFNNEHETYDISLGTIERGLRSSDDYEYQGHQWADHSTISGDYGVSILNDCKYGWDKPAANQLRLTLLHTPSCGAYMHQASMDIGENKFTYSLFPHDGNWSEQTQMEAAHLNQPLVAFTAPKHEGALGKQMEFVKVSTNKVAIKDLKKAEDSDELVVRVYEWAGEDQQNVELTFPAEIVSFHEVNALENEVDNTATLTSANTISFPIGHYQPKSFAVKLASPAGISGNSGKSGYVDIAYNFDVMSYDSSKGDATSVYSYAFPAEQISDEMTIDEIPFRMGSRENGQKNVLRCNNQTITFTRTPEQKNLYLLMASGNETGTEAKITMGDEEMTIAVPYFSGLAGEVLNDYNLASNFRNENIAVQTTHAHSVTGKSNEAMRRLYMYKYKVVLPDGVDKVTLNSSDRKLLLFAATVTDMDIDEAQPASPIYTTVEYDELGDTGMCGERLVPSTVKFSHQNGTNESAAKANDLNPQTKWCVPGNQSETPYIEYDFDEPVEVCQWFMLNAGIETSDYITKGCKLQRYTDDGNWEDVDIVTDNADNKMMRGVEPFKTTKVRLQITRGEQDGTTTRVYEFTLYGRTSSETAVEEVRDGNATEEAIYSVDGIRLDKPRTGINIIRYSDGTVRKVLSEE